MIPEVGIDDAPAGYDNQEASAWANGYESAREAAQVVIERLQAEMSFRSGVTLTVQQDLEVMQRQRDLALDEVVRLRAERTDLIHKGGHKG